MKKKKVAWKCTLTKISMIQKIMQNSKIFQITWRLNRTTKYNA